ncbi:hydantoinase/oxoprolinase family protein [Acuticoccus mangrovi]|uniref:Hydantoinase/oxoprolinase family protein n=1 Tax=Acuticoccus mangrovi TaxID=2796142 RepID=A0A934MJP0_9HYPH|nr:hydantoinase/oxoprolinase family protein [Acuticoccus mangrovi]MBJ3778511.1 hydantoinase/oxoprolinase family protein [Acuticoccus mangrovi]
MNHSSIEIDIGGTFTDCYVTSRDGRTTWCKVRTTPHDLGLGLSRAIDEAAQRLDTSGDALLEETSIVRYSTTVALNKLIERSGPKLAYITTSGFDDTLLIGRASQWSDGLPFKEQRNVARVNKPVPLIPKHLTVGVKERIGSFGEVLRPLDEDDFLAKLDHLVDQGVRGFVVCTLFSYLNPVHELKIRELIEREYDESYLGRMPVFLSHEVSPRKMEYTRSTMTLLNAYLHQSIYEELVGIGQQLRSRGYKAPLMMVHNTGGMASVFRSSAVQTFSGGPVAGLMGSAAIGESYGRSNVVTTDMGGTSFDIGMVVQGSTRFYQFAPTIDRWVIDATILDTRSIGAGGGSIARVSEELGGRLDVGPESAGSIPGPVSYDQGGREPTVTDADLVLGYLDADNFHGGKLTLNKARAERVIGTKIAKPLGVSVPHAALLIKRIIDAKMGLEIHKETVLKGYDPRDFTVFAMGGAGPVHCCGYTAAANMSEIVVFPFSSAFCAFGSSTMDVLHVYERSQRITLLKPSDPDSWLADGSTFNAVVEDLSDQARRDFSGEGFDSSKLTFELELEMRFGGQLNVKRVASPMLRLTGTEDARTIAAAFEKEFSEAYSAMGLNPDAGIEIEGFILKARLPQPRPVLPVYPEGGRPEGAKEAQTGTRLAFWDVEKGFEPTPVYQMNLLLHGDRLRGPAIIEDESTTLVLDPGWTLNVDRHHALVLSRETA